MGIEVIKEGNLQANGEEQELVEFTQMGKIEGYINLSNLAQNDTVVIRQYQKIYGDYSRYAQESYSNAQALPAIYITPKSGKDGVKITIQQTGIPKAFTYCFFRETVPTSPPASFSV